MNRSQAIRQIYHELQKSLGGEATPAEILDCAKLVLDCAEDVDTGNHYKLRKLRTPFVELGVDELIEKWSWKIMCRDYRGEDDYIPRPRTGDLIDQLLAA